MMRKLSMVAQLAQNRAANEKKRKYKGDTSSHTSKVIALCIGNFQMDPG
jgi:hypothetical protein